MVYRPETNDRDHRCSTRCFVGGTDGAGGWRGRGGVAANGRSIATVDFAGEQEVAEETSRKEWKSSPKLTYLRRIPHRGTRAAVVVVGGGGGGLLMSMMLGEM